MKKLRDDIQTVLEEEGLLELLPVDIQKMLKKEVPEEKVPKEKPSKPSETKKEGLDKMARDIAPVEYREWSDLFEVLHFSAPPKDQKRRAQTIEKRMCLLGTKTGEEHRLLRDALRKTELRAFIDAKDPFNALQIVFSKEKLSKENLKERLRTKIDEIKKIIEEEKAKLPKAPGNKELMGILEKDAETKELIDTLDFIRQGFDEYSSAGILPRGFKDDLDELKRILKRRQEKDDPLVKARSRANLITAYIELLKPRKPELFKKWNKKEFLKEMTRSLNRVVNIHKKLLFKT